MDLPASERRAACLYHFAREQNRWPEGEAHLTVLLAADPDDAHAASQLARLRLDRGETRSAAELFRRAASSFAAGGEFVSELYARLNLAECLRLEHRLDAAADQLSRSVELAEALGSIELVARARLAGARLERRRGADLQDLYRQLQDLRDRLDAAPAPPEYGALRLWHWEMGAILEDLNRPEQAHSTYRRWLDLAAEEGHDYDGASAGSGVARSLAALPARAGRREEIVRVARGVLEDAEVSGHAFAARDARLLLGRAVPGEAGRLHLRRCVDSARDDGTTPALCRFALAASLIDERPAEAAEVYDRALAAVAAAQNPWAVAHSWSDRFQVSFSLLPRRSAIADALAVLDLIEALRALQLSERGRIDFFAGWTDAYRALAGRLLESGDAHERAVAFGVGERMRARVLLDSLASSDARPEPPPELAAERAAILDRLVRSQRRLQSPSLSAVERDGLTAELEAAERELERLEARLGGAAIGEWSHGPADLDAVIAALDDDEAFFSFQLAPDVDVFGSPAGGSWLSVIAGGAARSYRLPNGPLLETQVATLLGLLADPDVDPKLLEGAAGALYDGLLARAVGDLPASVERRIVAPDGLLHLLPFELLAPGARWSTVPSATFWLHWRGAEVGPPSALVFADPAAGLPSAPPASAPPLGQRPAGHRSELLRGLDLERLPYARDEGRAVVRRLGAASRLLLDDDASERALHAADLASYGILHFATHALVDGENPRRSAIVLASDDGAGDGAVWGRAVEDEAIDDGAIEDGLVQPREIAALDLGGQLVVLSACRSAGGSARQGEGVESLARAFFQAGARGVVASRWRLRDDDAAAFFDAFYAGLARGLTVVDAVADARSERRAAGAGARAWAGVVVLGDGAWAPIPGGVAGPSSTRAWLAAVLFALLLAGAASVSIGRRSSPPAPGE